VLTSAAPTPASSGVGNKQVKKKVEAIMAPLIPSQTTATTVTASQPEFLILCNKYRADRAWGIKAENLGIINLSDFFVGILLMLIC